MQSVYLLGLVLSSLWNQPLHPNLSSDRNIHKIAVVLVWTYRSLFRGKQIRRLLDNIFSLQLCGRELLRTIKPTFCYHPSPSPFLTLTVLFGTSSVTPCTMGERQTSLPFTVTFLPSTIPNPPGNTIAEYSTCSTQGINVLYLGLFNEHLHFISSIVYRRGWNWDEFS